MFFRRLRLRGLHWPWVSRQQLIEIAHQLKVQSRRNETLQQQLKKQRTQLAQQCATWEHRLKGVVSDLKQHTDELREADYHKRRLLEINEALSCDIQKMQEAKDKAERELLTLQLERGIVDTDQVARQELGRH
jgi:hypothetical protein